MTSTLLLIFLSLCVGVGAWLFFLWAVKSGQYDEPEKTKFRMLDDDEETWGATGSGKGGRADSDSRKGDLRS